MKDQNSAHGTHSAQQLKLADVLKNVTGSRFLDETAVLGCCVRVYTVRYVMGRQSAYKMCANVRRANFETSVHRYHIRHTVLSTDLCVVLDTPCNTKYISLRSERP
ncbi:hypothetical protein HBI57_117240 [Parastagonospora nodorum]|nr:hypothetical protein HBI57_117240 [Parastagonospora nodorum]